MGTPLQKILMFITMLPEEKQTEDILKIKTMVEGLLNEEKQLITNAYKSDRDIQLLRDRVEWDTRSEHYIKDLLKG